MVFTLSEVVAVLLEGEGGGLLGVGGRLLAGLLGVGGGRLACDCLPGTMLWNADLESDER